MYELTQHSRVRVFEHLEAHPDSAVWGSLFARVPGGDVEVFYQVMDERAEVQILRIV